MVNDFGILLAQLPLRTSLVLVVILAIMISVFGSYVVNSLVPVEQLAENNTVGGIKYQFIGEVYAVTLGLALIGAFDHFTNAQTVVQREAATLSSLNRAVDAYDTPQQAEDRARMKEAIRQYARAVVEKEWHSMSFGIANDEVSIRFGELANVFNKVDPVTKSQEVLQQNTVEWVREINEMRSFRLTTVSRSLIALVWAVILSGTVIALAFPWFFGTFNYLSQTVMSTLLSTFLLLHLVVILHLAYPFAGETAVSPSAFIALAR
jgi:hypothetical protein